MDDQNVPSTTTMREAKSPQTQPPAQPTSFKAIGWVMGLLLIPLAILGGYWFTARDEAKAVNRYTTTSAPAPTSSAGSMPAKPVDKLAEPTTSATPTTLHADLYFDFDSARLRAEATTRLQHQLTLLEHDGSKDWAVLIQGYTDQHGPVEYNRRLALKRAESTKRFLVESGIPEGSIKVVTLGKDAALCVSDTKECGRLNRRVHVEFVKLGKAALLPTPQAIVVKDSQPVAVMDGSSVATDGATDEEIVVPEDEAAGEAQEGPTAEDVSEPAIEAQ